ncbi:MAG: HAMP domain-containing sensor histidine kinase [Natronomonas sp.]
MDRYSISGGVSIALLGFVVAQLIVGLTPTDDVVAFVFVGLVPLFLVFLLTIFGLSLAVGRYDRSFVSTVVRWCGIGTGATLFISALTLVGTAPGSFTDIAVLESQKFLSNFLAWGTTSGALVGLYAAHVNQQRDNLQNRANRLVLLNRLLRDRVINASFIIKGYAESLDDADEQAASVIARKAQQSIDTVEDIKYLSNTAETANRSVGDVALGEKLTAAVESVRSSHPEADYDVADIDPEITVQANEHLETVFRNLLENAVTHSNVDRPQITVSITTTRREATVAIGDDGPGLPAEKQRLLADGAITEYDDPTTGFGLNIVRLLVENFGGSIRTDVTDDGTTIEVTLQRHDGTEYSPDRDRWELVPAGLKTPQLLLAIATGLIAGVTMGLTMELFGDTIPTIGSLYGAENVVVGWIAHEFHSVVFGLGYAVILLVLPDSYVSGALRRIGIAVVLGIVLWAVAAGIVMPAWLLALGVQVPFPNLSLAILLTHIVWGATAGIVYHFGERLLD